MPFQNSRSKCQDQNVDHASRCWSSAKPRSVIPASSSEQLAPVDRDTRLPPPPTTHTAREHPPLMVTKPRTAQNAAAALQLQGRTPAKATPKKKGAAKPAVG